VSTARRERRQRVADGRHVPLTGERQRARQAALRAPAQREQALERPDPAPGDDDVRLHAVHARPRATGAHRGDGVPSLRVSRRTSARLSRCPGAGKDRRSRAPGN
jgi:hypothetical protein